MDCNFLAANGGTILTEKKLIGISLKAVLKIIKGSTSISKFKNWKGTIFFGALLSRMIPRSKYNK